MSDDAVESPDQKLSRAKAFRCPSCNGELTYSATAQKMACPYCGATVEVPAAPDASIVEHGLAAGLAGQVAKGLGAAVRTTRCQDCGATVSFPSNVTSRSCDFCGSSQVLEQQENRNLVRPESVVPFQVDRAAASSRFSSWLSRLWFRPSDLKARAKVTELAGVYVPYWTFDARVESTWTADAGYYYYETEEYTARDDKGNTEVKTRQVRKVRWEPASGARSDSYDDVLVCASKGLPQDLADRLSSFDTTALRPYDPAFLSGWKAEEYQIDLAAAWRVAQGRIGAEQESRCSRDVPGDTQRGLRVSSAFSDETFKHVLLPVWLSAYRYGEKVYRFLVNGQTGEVVGKAPWSIVKITLFSLALVALAALAYILYLRYHG